MVSSNDEEPQVRNNVGKDSRVSRRDNVLRISLAVLGVVIVGLIIAIIVVMLNPKTPAPDEGDDNEQTVEESLSIITDSSLWCEKTISKYTGVSDYTLDEMYDMFEEKIENSGLSEKTFATICYAKFVYKYGDNVYDAIEIMEDAESLVDNDQFNLARLDYYMLLKQLYESKGDVVMAEAIDGIITSLSNLPDEEAEPASGGDDTQNACDVDGNSDSESDAKEDDGDEETGE